MACFSDVPPRNDTNQPWEEVAVDLAGPWEIEVTQLGKVKIFTFTIIDTSTNLAEIKRIDNKTSAHISQLFVNEWLSRYPRPLRCIHDKGGEFVGFPFQDMLRRNGIRAVRITTKNPQANAIIERLHLTMGNMLCTQLKQAPTVATAIEYVDNILASITYATRVATHRTLQISPGSLVFQRDMLLPIPIIANYAMLRAKRHASPSGAARQRSAICGCSATIDVNRLRHREGHVTSTRVCMYAHQFCCFNGNIFARMPCHPCHRKVCTSTVLYVVRTNIVAKMNRQTLDNKDRNHHGMT